MKKVTIYTSSTCKYCAMAKDFLKKKGVEYEEKNINTDQKARNDLIRMGFMGVPVIIVGDKVIPGYDPEAIEKALS